jgi:hypothetical protein
MRRQILGSVAALALLSLAPAAARGDALISGDASGPGKPMSDRLYGIFYEDINHGADGGLGRDCARIAGGACR